MPVNYIQNRVFFHELGHFVAHEIIFRTFGIHKTERIEIKRYGNDYAGELVPAIPEGQDPNTPLINQCEKIVELIYGCIFQAVYLRTDFKDCFNHKSQGYDDASAWAGILVKIGHNKQIQISTLQNAYFTYLKESDTLANFFQINPSKYIVDITVDLSIVDMNLLLADINEEIENNKTHLLEFVEYVRKIIN
jgi:hypothetical protein